LQTLINEKNEIKIENESLLKQVMSLKLSLDTAKNENSDLIANNASLRKVNEKYRENEYYLQQRIEDLRHKLNERDVVGRQKDEVIFGLTRSIEALQYDVKNLEIIEEALKREIEDLLNKRKTLEDINQGLK